MAILDIHIGQKYGKLTTIEKVKINGESKWLCECECGNRTISRPHDLIYLKKRSCGCLISKNLTGMVFGSLTVVKMAEDKNNRHYWTCRCSCGEEIDVTTSCLILRGQKSCWKCRGKNISKSHIKHGKSGTPEYVRYLSHKRREREKNLDCEWTTDMELELSKFFPMCVLCASSENLCTDHVRPLSIGYGLKPGNAVKLCNECNGRKRCTDIKDLHPYAYEILMACADEFKRYWDGLNNA